jgi:L-aspartate oxidase
MPDYDPRAELAPRDVVTRSIFQAMQAHGADHVLLDLTHLSTAYLKQRFPTILAGCLDEGIDAAITPIPVAPAAHYLMGGIRTDLNQATTIPGLFAAGECACTGVHGANRLASNSLLECLVFGRRAGVAAVEETVSPAVAQLVSQLVDQSFPHDGAPAFAPQTGPWDVEVLTQCSTTRSHRLDDLALIMRTYGGPLRTGAGLTTALKALDGFGLQYNSDDPTAITLANAALVARLIVAGALRREESRGAHFRADFPASEDDWCRHLIQQRGAPARLVTTVTAEQPGDVLSERVGVATQPSLVLR